ncbi:xaa-Pro aminopeptidase 3 [Silurus meridionalis]|uniref:xaa-Pro aminopeptidase 3 n=1 Tax=Silurus meridionalis TaxID=175797 RepID=UPI001EEC0F8B|nr:xaa-Pro aminopeptidase 3 [Silurus meridionalis]XP_046700007.1 xaa-Pro aminopeptidase 3 [Silurus meridionalis]
MLQFPSTVLRAAVHSHLTPGVLKCVCRSVWTKPGGWTSKTVPLRCLGQPSPYTHPQLMRHGEVTPGLTQTEYEVRRQSLASLIESRVPDSSHVLIVLSHPVRYMTNDIPYPFHQNQDFLYLTGVLEPDCALVMYGSPRPNRTLLFVPPRDPARELWDGPRSGRDGAAALTGIQTVHSIEELGAVLNKLKGSVVWYDGSKPVHPRLHQTHVVPVLEGQVSVRPLRSLTHSLRAIKSPAELQLMERAGDITSHAFRNTMAMCRGDVDEALIYAKFDFECRAHGANFLAYPPVVAGGNRANTLHYINNNQIVKDGEMVLLDGGCEYFGYVSDVTRTWPVSGRFSEAQRCVYEAVLEVQLACLELCVPGISLDHIYSSMLTLLSKQLLRLAVLPHDADHAHALRAARRYCPHHVGHYLGMDVHDTPDLSRSQPLQAGMVITIEPGLYFSEDDDACPQHFRGIGVRIEDDVVIREQDGPLILSTHTPKSVRGVESACAGSQG